jgi:hypothetical protein
LIEHVNYRNGVAQDHTGFGYGYGYGYGYVDNMPPADCPLSTEQQNIENKTLFEQAVTGVPATT